MDKYEKLKSKFKGHRPLTEAEVDELRKRHAKFCKENNTDGFVEGSLDNLKHQYNANK